MSSGWRQLGWGIVGAMVGVLFWVSPLNPMPGKDFGLDSPPGKTITVDALFGEKRRATVRIEQRSSVFEIEPESIGTGFIINAEGYVLTAYHVISRAERLSAVGPNRTRYSLSVVGFDSIADLALLKINTTKSLPFVPLTKRRPRVGENVLAIGNSRGDFLQPRVGKLLRLSVTSSRADFPQGTLELDAPIGPGDSGGPILNGDGEALGVVSYIRLDEDGNLLGGYAVPVSLEDKVVKNLFAGVKRDIPVIGFSAIPHELTLEARNKLGIDSGSGVVVGFVASQSPAARAGMRVYDVITAVSGESTPTYNDVVRKVRQRQIGDTVTVSVRRGTRTLQLPIRLVAKENIR